MTKFKTTKFSTTLWMIGAVVIAGCQSVTPATNNMAQEVLKPSTCVVEPPPVDENGKPMPVDLDDRLSMELRVFFDKDSAEIKQQYTPELNKIIAFADRCSNLTFFVQGHTSKIEQKPLTRKLYISKARLSNWTLSHYRVLVHKVSKIIWLILTCQRIEFAPLIVALIILLLLMIPRRELL